MAPFAPLISKNLGVKKVAITYQVESKKRSAEIPGILHMAGAPGSTFSDHGMRWDNSGKNGHYAPIRWSNYS